MSAAEDPAMIWHGPYFAHGAGVCCTHCEDYRDELARQYRGEPTKALMVAPGAPAAPIPALSGMERLTHVARLCPCHRDLWGPACAPFLHGTVPIVLDSVAAGRIVTCGYCQANTHSEAATDGK